MTARVPSDHRTLTPRELPAAGPDTPSGRPPRRLHRRAHVFSNHVFSNHVFSNHVFSNHEFSNHEFCDHEFDNVAH